MPGTDTTAGFDRAGCEVFPMACGMPMPARRRSVASTAAPTEVTQAADRYVLDNGVVQLRVSTSELCAATLRRADGVDHALTFDRPDDATGCVVQEIPSPWGGASDLEGRAISVVWTGPTGSQRTVVGLGDFADTADLATASQRHGETSLTNLGAAPLVWSFDGEEVAVAPGEAATVSM